MYKRIILFLVCFVVNYTVLFAQLNTRNFYPILSNAYQDRQAFSILETDDGFMWFVNDYGISRYDGNQIKNYRIDVGWRAFLKKNSNGDIYVCSANGKFFKYNELADIFEQIFNIFLISPKSGSTVNKNQAAHDLQKNTAKAREITAVDIDKWGRLWFSTYLGILCYNPEKNEWIDYDHEDLNITHLMLVNEKMYLFGKNSIYTVKLSQVNQIANKIKKEINLITNDKVISSFYDTENGRLYWGTFNKGLFVLNNKKEIKQLISISNSPVRSIKQYDRDILLVGVDGLGIYEYNIYTEKITAYQKSDENNLGTLGSNGIYDIYVDSAKRIWVATYSKGVNVYDPNQIHFKKISHLIEVPNSLANNYVNVILEDRFKNLWFGTNNGISVRNNSNGSWIHLLDNKSNVEKNSVVLSLCNDANGDVWAGGYGFGLKIINPVNLTPKSIDLFKITKESLNNYIFSSVNSGSEIWAAGVSNKLFSINTNTSAIKDFPISGNRVIVNEDDNHLLLLNATQISSFNKLTGKIDLQLNALLKKNEKIKNAQFVCINRNGDNLWIGTSQSGLIRYSYSKNSIDVYDITNGLPSNNVLSIQIDDTKCLWLGTDEGLCYLNPATSIVIPFKTQNESEKGIFNYMASCKRSDGSLIFGTKQGAIMFDPSSFLVSPSRGLLAWTEFFIYNQDKYTRENGEILDKGLNKCTEIELHYHENSFRIGFQELNFNQCITTRYTYRLKGASNDFSALSNENSASFYNLPPGTYNLIVRSYFADKEGKYMERTIKIIICQPWWNTIWAWIIWMALLLATTYALYKYFVRRQERRFSDEKTRFFINVSHDMRTPITLIKAPLGDLVNDESLSPSSRYLVHMINNNVNRLFEMINRILDFEKSDEEQMRLFPKEHELNQYVTEIVENFQSYAEIKGITIESQLAKNAIWVSFDRIKMEMVVENLISNAIKYSNQGGFVNVLAGNDIKNWWIEVQDNGIGIPKNEQKKIFKRFFRAENAINSKQIGSGMGLLLVNNLTKFMGGSVFFESEEGVKTVFRITFPKLNTGDETLKNLNHLSNQIQVSSAVIADNEIPIVLFVDDNDEIRNYISKRLSADYNVMTAPSVAEALKILNSNNVNIIISDIMMPEVSGLEFCERLKADQRFSHIPVILLSALSDKKDILKGLQIGADDYITKPFETVFLKQRIDNILENRKRLKQYFQSNNGDVSELTKQDFVNELDKLFLDKLDRVFEPNIANHEYTIEILCRDIGMSRTVFYNRLKNLTNLTPNDYIRVKRLEKAAELLKSHKYLVLEVAEMVGYNDVKHFSALFSKKYGCTPGKYGNKITA
jgi:signal transduction histidine kinase/DNA-binding response OmpR family regulator/ligand-binding sensor domain-containing protein